MSGRSTCLNAFTRERTYLFWSVATRSRHLAVTDLTSLSLLNNAVHKRLSCFLRRYNRASRTKCGGRNRINFSELFVRFCNEKANYLFYKYLNKHNV